MSGNIPKICRHPGCKAELEPLDFCGRMMPGSPYCEEHVKLYQPSSTLKKSLGQKIVLHKEMWGCKYASYQPELAPSRVIRYHEKGSKSGVKVDVRQVIEVVSESGKGCLFQGDTGLGKTFLLYHLSDFFLRDTGRMPLYTYSPQLHLDLADAGRSDDGGAKSRLLTKVNTAGRLFIDDIGSSNWTDSFEEAFKLIVETRGKLRLPIFTSLQQTAEEFINKPTETNRGCQTWKRRDAILRRLADECLIFKFSAA